MALAEVADRSEVRRIERDNHHEIVPPQQALAMSRDEYSPLA